MKRRFKSKRKRKYYIIRWALLLILTLFITKKIIDFLPLKTIFEKKSIEFKIDINKLLLSKGLNFKKEEKINEPVFKEITTSKIINIKPKIFLYNTHQREEYVDYTVYKASLTLKSKLEKLGINVELEDTDIIGQVQKKNLSYKDSYKITRNILTKKISDKIDLYIDIHRDSVPKKATTANINKKNVAKVMFVVGAKHLKYKDNYKVADNLNKMLKNINTDLTRGLYVKKSSNFNQDLNKNILLIELGGSKNNKVEVDNAIEYLSKVLSNYVKE